MPYVLAVLSQGGKSPFHDAAYTGSELILSICLKAVEAALIEEFCAWRGAL